jgi:predicted O-methyltransferase YrrM
MSLILTDVDFMTVEEIRNEMGWPLEYTSVKGLAPYIARLGDGATGIEIGTCRGESAYLILETCANVNTIHCIDPWLAYDDWAGKLDQETMDKFEAITRKNLEQFGDRANIIKSKADDVVGKFADESVDFVFVDGDHSYEATLKDIENYYNKVRKGGIFSGHDYNLEPVRQAIEDFRNKNKVRIPIQKTINSVWFWYK